MDPSSSPVPTPSIGLGVQSIGVAVGAVDPPTGFFFVFRGRNLLSVFLSASGLACDLISSILLHLKNTLRTEKLPGSGY
ncbi:hypothetical protein BGX38DRAFT_1196766, partial [Terfezia claveryi]